MEYAINLNEIELHANQISDFSPLAGLTNLTQLNLGDNQISDISSLAGLTNLTFLWLSNNQISDISLLANLTNLTRLWLWNNQISDFSPVAGLTNLTDLRLDDNQISDISLVANLTNLTELWLPNNLLSDLSPLAGLTNLTFLNLAENQIRDISPLAGLTLLTNLHLQNNFLDLTEGSDALGVIESLQAQGTNVTYLPQNSLPSITAEPDSSEITSGGNVVLSVTATGTGLSYQWYVGQSGNTSNPIQDATANTHDTGALTQTTAFWVRVTNTGGSDDSVTATITVVAGSTLNVTLFNGWNWVSFNVTPEDASVGAVLQGYALRDNDVIKGQEGSATYFDGQWFPPAFELKTGPMYKIWKQSEGDESFEVIGLPADPSTSINLISGWNWIGVNVQEPAEVDVLAHSGGFVNNDIIKGQEGSATYFGGQWFASSESFRLKPGKGYQLNTVNPGQLTFDNVVIGSQAIVAGKK